MWIFNISLLEVVFRTVIIYIIVLTGIRLTGKREVGQMASYELVLILLLANSVQNAMTGPDTSLTGGMVGACTLLIANAILTRVSSRSRKVRTAIEGTPTVLILKGKIVKKNMEKEHIAMKNWSRRFANMAYQHSWMSVLPCWRWMDPSAS